MVATLSAVQGNFDYHTFFSSSNPLLFTGCYVAFQITIVMVLSNLVYGFIYSGVWKV